MSHVTDVQILLVEDNPNDEALTLRALRKNNFQEQVVVACDGAEALDYWLEHNEAPPLHP